LAKPRIVEVSAELQGDNLALIAGEFGQAFVGVLTLFGLIHYVEWIFASAARSVTSSCWERRGLSRAAFLQR
jgi:hypothetical protein